MTKEVVEMKDTKFEILPILRESYSPIIFSEIPITEPELRSIFEAGRWASSSYNRQPWRVIWGIKGSKTYDRIFSCLSEFNQSWAKNAPLLLLNAYKTTTEDGKENFHALHDLGLFMGNASAQAQHLGIALHQMAGVDHKKAKKEFKFPEEFHVATAVAVGYYGGNTNDLPENLRDEEKPENRTRMLQREFTFNGNYMNEPGLDSSKSGLNNSK